MACRDRDSQNHKDLLRGRSKDPATMERIDGQISREQERARPLARAEESEEERETERVQLMLNDLGVDRASSVTAADFVRNSPPVNVLALEHGRAFRRPGTAAYTAAQENRGQLSAWANAFEELRDDGADDGKAVLDDGQGHRTEMMQRLQKAGPVLWRHGGGQGGRARGSGRGGGVMGTRGRGDRTVSSSHRQHASQDTNHHANESNTVNQPLTVTTATVRRAPLSSPRCRAGPRGSASPRSRDDRRAGSSTSAGSNPNISAGRALPSPTEAFSNPKPWQRWLGAVAERTSVEQQTQVRPTVRPPSTRSTPSPLVLANPSDFMSAMTHLRTSNSGAAASGSTEIRVEGVSSVTAKETAKSTVTESSGSISIKTTGSDHEITAPPEIIFSPEIDAAPYGVRVLTPPPAPQRSISPGTYSDDLIGLEIEVPGSVKMEEEAADQMRTQAHLSSSDQTRFTTEQTLDLSNAQTLLKTLQGLSGLSSFPSLAEAITDLEAKVGEIYETQTTTGARSEAEIAGPLDGTSAPIQTGSIRRPAARSSGESQGSGNQVSSLRKSSSGSAASQPSNTASSPHSSTLSQSGSIASRVQRMQDQWTIGVMNRLREVSSVTMRDLGQSLHHDPYDEYQPRLSTRVRLPTTNLGEYLLPVGNRDKQTALLSTPAKSSTHDEAARNTVIYAQTPTSRLQEPRSSSSLDKDFFEKATRSINKVGHLQQDTRETVHGSQDLHASRTRDRVNAPLDSRNTAVPRSVNPFQQQSSAAVTLPSQRVESTNFNRRAPTSACITSSPEVNRTNTVDAVRRTILPNIAPVNPFLEPTSTISTPSAPRFAYSFNLPTALSRSGAGASFNPIITISPRAQRLPSHPTVTRVAETAPKMATRITPSISSTTPNTAAPLPTASALGGGVSASRWSIATSSMPSTLVAASNTAAQLPVSTARSEVVGATRWNTVSNAISSSVTGTTATIPLATATALGGDVGASRWSTATGVYESVRSGGSTADEMSVSTPFANSSTRELRSISDDLGLNDTTSLFSNYQRPHSQQTPNVPEFILQARALQNDPGAAARAQYGTANTTRTYILDNQPLSPSVVSISESASSNATVGRSRDPWNSARRRRL